MALKQILLTSLFLAAPSAFAVLHGVQIDEATYPAIKKVTLKQSGTCTGSFIGSHTMVTAAHCIDGGLVDGFFSKSLELTVDGIKAAAYRMHPKYESRATDMLAYDVAVVQFPANSNFHSLTIAPHEAKQGDPVILVGYGTAENMVGIKRRGFNYILESIMGQYLVKGNYTDTNRAVGSAGDSGGPLLNEQGQLVGVTSRESAPNMTYGGERSHLSSYININEPEILTFIQSAVKALARSTGRSGD